MYPELYDNSNSTETQRKIYNCAFQYNYLPKDSDGQSAEINNMEIKPV